MECIRDESRPCTRRLVQVDRACITMLLERCEGGIRGYKAVNGLCERLKWWNECMRMTENSFETQP